MKWMLSILLFGCIIGIFASFVKHQESTAVSGAAKDLHATMDSVSFDVNTGEVKGAVSTKYRQEAVKQMDQDNEDFFGTLAVILGVLSAGLVIVLFRMSKHDRFFLF